MTNWKDHPNLFANGKFKGKSEVLEFLPERTDLIVGFEFNSFYGDTGSVIPVEYCQLIARPIGDMTDKEWNVYAKQYDDSNADSLAFVKKLIKDGWLPHYLFLYLLSIGVYPFDDETDVIFKTKN